MPPEVNLLNEKNNGETLLKLVDAGYVKSAHDVSLGGIITAISKMSIKGNKGIKLKKSNRKDLISHIFRSDVSPSGSRWERAMSRELLQH